MRKLMVTVAAVAGLALVTGCKRSDDMGGQGGAGGAGSVGAEAHQDLSQAQREAHEKLVEGGSNLQQEGQEVRDAQTRLTQEQEQLAQDEGGQMQDQAQGGSGAAGTATTVQGSIQSKGKDMLVLSVPGQGSSPLRLKMDDQTRVMQNNREVKLEDLQEGSQVRASYVSEGKDMLARDVTVLPMNAPDKAQKKQ